MRSYRPYFREAIQKYFPANAATLIRETENQYAGLSKDTAFALTSPNPIDRRLDFCAYFLAMIITLDHAGIAYATIREICLDITTRYVQPRNGLQRYVKQLLPKLTGTLLFRQLIKVFAKKVSSNPSKDGFIAKIITDKEATFGLGYGVDILECGICKLFSKHGYGKYASILCEVDVITSGLAGLELVRNGTIALGAEKCDFRYKRKKV